MTLTSTNLFTPQQMNIFNLDMFKNAVILITGGTGSFGTQFCNRVLESDISEIRVLSRDEKKQEDLRHRFSDPRIKCFIGDVRSSDSLRIPMQGVNYVFHAAALKQVPSCEFFPMEALSTNVLGLNNVVNAAIASGVSKLVCLSTDKAVYPINVMGLTKSLMEKIALSHCRQTSNKLRIMVTRYGNVIGSRGSVIPLFLNQIKNRRPITITDENMTRFMMTMDDAIDLVFFAFEHGEAGSTYVKKSPGATVSQIAKACLSISGVPSDYPVQIIGVRHGEKNYETLLSSEESRLSESLDGYYRIPLDGRDINYKVYTDSGLPARHSAAQYNSENTFRLSDEETRELIIRGMDCYG
jgi:UDP-N-acetylglucosamine 4,6-dehydratase